MPLSRAEKDKRYRQKHKKEITAKRLLKQNTPENIEKKRLKSLKTQKVIEARKQKAIYNKAHKKQVAIATKEVKRLKRLKEIEVEKRKREYAYKELRQRASQTTLFAPKKQEKTNKQTTFFSDAHTEGNKIKNLLTSTTIHRPEFDTQSETSEELTDQERDSDSLPDKLTSAEIAEYDKIFRKE